MRPEIAAMAPYTPIVPFNVLSRRLGRRPEDIIKLDANENPYGPSPRIYQALAAEAYYHIYPDPESTALREALSRYTGVDASHIVVGHGADELIDLVMRLFITPGDAVINCPPTFGMYPFDTELNGGTVITVPRNPDFSVDIKHLMPTVDSTVKGGGFFLARGFARDRPSRYGSKGPSRAGTPTGTPKLLFVTSPNNPDGSILPDADLRSLLALPLIVVLDEAYVEFAGQETFPSSVARGPSRRNAVISAGFPAEMSTVPRVPSRATWVTEHDNLIVLRTFSKWAGLAGLRVGYGIFPKWIRAQLLKIKQPYNVNVAGTTAALASLEDTEYLMENVQKIVAERERLAAALAASDFLEPYRSQANFVLCRVVGRNAAELQAELARQGILIRYFNTPGLQDHLRISVGKPSETDALLKALAG